MKKVYAYLLFASALASVGASLAEAQAPRNIPYRARRQATVSPAAQLFPLAVGNRWTFAGTGALPVESRTVLVTSQQRIGDNLYFELDGWSFEPALVRMTEEGRLVGYNPETRSEQLWYDFSLPEGASWTPAFRNQCVGTATVRTRDGDVRVPAGVFGGATIIGYRGTECADAGFSEEVFVPGIGPLKQGVISIAGETTWSLVRADVGPMGGPSGGLSITLSTDQPLYYANLQPPVDPALAVPKMQAAISLKNATENVIPLVFSSGQTYDFLVRDARGQVLYRWSEGKFFTEAIRAEEMGPGQRSYAAEIPLGANGEPFPEGDYILEAWITAQPDLGRSSVEQRFPYAASIGFQIRHVF